MSTYLVSYDLQAPGKNYSDLIAHIKTYPWAKPLESTWLIKTPKTALEVCNGILAHVDRNDKVFVAAISSPTWYNLPPDVVRWIHSNT